MGYSSTLQVYIFGRIDRYHPPFAERCIDFSIVLAIVAEVIAKPCTIL